MIAPRAAAALLLLLTTVGCERLDDPRNFGVVEEGAIYRSGRLEAPELRRAIAAHGLATVIDLGGWEGNEAEWQANQAVADELGVTRYAIHMPADARANPNGYLAVLRLLADRANHPVLVHCDAGDERTGAVVVLYRHLVEGKLVQPSYEESFVYGHAAEDYGWIAYLVDWLGALRRAWRAGGWIEGLPPVEPRAGGISDAWPVPGRERPPSPSASSHPRAAG